MTVKHASIVLFALLVSCNAENGLATVAPVTPAQAGAVASHVTKTTYYVHLHPLDTPDLATLHKIHDEWHAGGIRMEYNLGNGHASYDALVSNALSVGLKIAFITPCTAAASDVALYARATGAAAKRYAGSGIIWELCNEPDLLFGENVTVGVANYVMLAKAIALAIRANDASALILTGGTSGKDSPNFVFAINAGKALARYVNGAAIHPYGISYGSIGSLIVDIAQSTGAVVYVTEWGSNGDQGLGVSMTSAKGLTPMFCVYEYQEQAVEKAAGDPTWGLVNTGAWSEFEAAAH